MCIRSMIPFEGRLKFKQRMPLKPVKVGIKMFVVSEAQTGYCHKFPIYLGKEGEDNGNERDLGKTALFVCVCYVDYNIKASKFILIISAPVFHFSTTYHPVEFQPAEL